MRWLFFGLFLVMFVITPLYLLNNVVMPELTSMKQFYGNTDQTVNSLVSADTPQNQ